MTTAITVPFNGAELYVVEHQNQPYTPMKAIVEGMGLTWEPQLRKLNANADRWGMIKMIIPTNGASQDAVCMPLRKLFGWLQTISPNKVRKEIRERILRFQNECDDVLWQHWTAQQPAEPIQASPALSATPRPEQQLRDRIYQLAHLRGVSITAIHNHYRRKFNSPLWPECDTVTVALTNKAIKTELENLTSVKNASDLHSEAEQRGLALISKAELTEIQHQLSEQQSELVTLTDQLAALMRRHESLCGQIQML
ncbi:hypothetical protein CS022_19535 [Veronia nyctiphanis]|uniref:Antirepressor protein ant N-terminal domain-containing protein n=1 Tax=Veronia nyctiphanis TaxID=1278244 RepID=A0A4Q0YP87_9GAMM|nr:phage antirepressor N-terminal domain-containing protein [Veronia nyctiphanis]RXJ71764.1 hypothetical protein CS022_19535 [Veronia nyctiphanis]